MVARINPSILAADFVNLQSELETIESADFIHVDVMDNHFVPNLTFGQQMVERLQQVSKLPLDVHLMISNVDHWALDFARIGVFSITFHAEASEDPTLLAQKLRDLGCRAGIAIKPQTAVEPFLERLGNFDQLLIMTVEPGFGGQKFMSEMMPKLQRAKAAAEEQQAETWLQVDGGIDETTIELASRSGADTFVAGSAIFRSANRAAEISKLRTLAELPST